MADEFEKATPRPWAMHDECAGGIDLVAWRIGPGDAEGRDYLADVHMECAQPDGSHRSDAESKANAELIVRAVNAFEPMREALKAVEWAGGPSVDHCPYCYRTRPEKHREGCTLAAALRAADAEATHVDAPYVEGQRIEVRRGTAWRPATYCAQDPQPNPRHRVRLDPAPGALSAQWAHVLLTDIRAAGAADGEGQEP